MKIPSFVHQSICHGLLILSMLSVGCQGDGTEKPNPESIETTTRAHSQWPAVVEESEFSVRLPLGLEPQSVAVSAAGTIWLGPGSTIASPNGSGNSAYVTNSGNGNVFLGPGATSGPIATTTTVKLMPKSTVTGDVHSGGKVFSLPGSVVAGSVHANGSIDPWKTFTWSPQLPDKGSQNVRVRKYESTALPPGGKLKWNAVGRWCYRREHIASAP
jgi:hypothetical protein